MALTKRFFSSLKHLKTFLQIYESKRPLTIGYYTDDGNVMPSPSCQRAVLEVKAMLEAQGIATCCGRLKADIF
jgi:hypothetical protein